MYTRRYVLLPSFAVSTDRVYMDILQIHTENNTNATVLILILLETMRMYGSSIYQQIHYLLL